MDDWIQTFTGAKIRPLDASESELIIEDIAHSLSLQCRFNGHCRTFYSVAEHSVRVADQLPTPELRLWGLLHDASEAYLSDLPRPLKQRLPEYREAEDRLMRTVADRFGLAWPMPREVRETDDRLLVTEARDLMAPPPEPWGLPAEPLPERIHPWPSEQARDTFLQRFRELTGSR